MAAIRVDFLYWSECPSHERALADLREEIAALGLEARAELTVGEVSGHEEAVAAEFPGSPTIRIDGTDVQPSTEPPQLTCRVYRRRDGRISPTPDPLDIREALIAASTTDSEEEP